MNKIVHISLTAIILLVLSSCNWGNPNPVVNNTPVVRLTIGTQDGATTFISVGQVINYAYTVSNTGDSPLAGPVIISDSPRLPTCPDVNTVGNLDSYLDTGETIICTAAYAITQADFDTGSVTNIATANVGGMASNQSGVTLLKDTGQSSVLTLTTTASPTTYGQVGQVITYTYVATNTGIVPLGPAQFVVTDTKLGAPLNCGPDATTLEPNQAVSCSGTYTIINADMNITGVTNNATASGAGQTSAPATTTVTNLTIPVTQTPTTVETATPSPSSNLTPGSTIQHSVAVGEWLIQIVRCYGATYSEVLNANPQIANPNFILPYMTVTVPRIGSAGIIYGPPCVTFYTAQSGDTWTSIAQAYNADLTVLQLVNPNGLFAGTMLKIPKNSAGSVLTGTAVPVISPTPQSAATMRITFDPGQTTASRIGLINPNETIHYVVSATPGQILSINLTASPSDQVAIGVRGPSGISLKQMDANPAWSTTVADGGDYFIDIASVFGASTKSYTLDVTLTPNAVPTATLTPSP